MRSTVLPAGLNDCLRILRLDDGSFMILGVYMPGHTDPPAFYFQGSVPRELNYGCGVCLVRPPKQDNKAKYEVADRVRRYKRGLKIVSRGGWLMRSESCDVANRTCACAYSWPVTFGHLFF